MKRLRIYVLAAGLVALAISPTHGFAQASQTLRGLSESVTVFRDRYAVPHVFATSWPDAACVLGYLHATDRLWEMDMFRRQASGNLAEIVGKDGLGNDILMRQLGIRRTCQAFWNSDGLPPEFHAEIEAYTVGVNARLAELDEDNLPLYFKVLDYQPQPWEPVDCLVMLKYMGWDQSGTSDDLWFGRMVEKLGATAVEELWPLDRPYEIPIVDEQFDRSQLSVGSNEGSRERKVSARRPKVDPSLQLLSCSAAYRAAFHGLEAARWRPRSDSFGSNNWAVDGSKTASGKPLLASDPHLGFMLPSLWYTAHLSVEGRHAAGVTFPGTPLIVIGHTEHHGWGITNMQADAVDYFVETVDDNDPLRYLHRGEWKTMERLTEEIPVRGADPHVLQIDSTVHGPVISRDERVISMAWTGHGTTYEPLAFWRATRATSARGFLDALDQVSVPAINIVYADVEGNIALHPCGKLPIRTRGAGRVPLDGASGDYDWESFIPREELPLAFNPACGFVASANGRPASIGYPHYLGWMWDPSYRTRRIHDMLRDADELTIDSMKPLQNAACAQCAAAFLPFMLEAMSTSDLDDSLEQAAQDVLSNWDYVADVESQAPAIWLRWFSHYREAVWDDEWAPRGIDQPGGSWGFTGNNRRQPMLEVLEYLTREYPESAWFDDKSTPQREQRDDCIRSAFGRAVDSLRQQFGGEIASWTWSNINVLRVSSLSEQQLLARSGGPVPGTCFTVNPGSNVGHVGGGASWRMLVDFGDVSTSVGVYPGGQSELPASPHYADQLSVWAAGEYLDLEVVNDPDQLSADARTTRMVFSP